ncbi:predicted protein [Sclerotinia sclerotiorum 1980 UF-70]|uniref:Uncharacterized protein n=1 Tax=Sclerotinia sclerotiorum (strain ATCC 18683 / 1980 / Ss-1) TaxID=665079 RepID=A7EZT5_SCLS1|nr:predicted protein [Sclerotinia sclerotiorum 1980 UF-70]EDN94977.1 predicted protein [Sclerotinia sclerotiorum 1980 UF-70]
MAFYVISDDSTILPHKLHLHLSHGLHSTGSKLARLEKDLGSDYSRKMAL